MHMYMYAHAHAHVHAHVHVGAVLCALIERRVVVCVGVGADVIKSHTLESHLNRDNSTRHVIHHFDRRGTHVHDYHSRAHLLLVIVEARIK